MNATARVARLRARLSEEGVAAFVATRPANVVYLTGFDGVFDDEDAHATVVTSDAALLYTDSRYAAAARWAAEGTGWEIRQPPADLYRTLCEDLASAGVTSLAMEDSVPHARFRYLSEQFAGNVAATRDWVESLRQVKDAEEVTRIEAAQRLTDRAFDHILGTLAPGVSERDVALELEFFLRREGSEGVAFPAIVASGPNSALPHAKVTDRRLVPGDFVKLDFGARVEGYCADMTRTVVLGRADEEQRRVYEAVLDANIAGIAAVAPGRPARDADAAARAVLAARGYGERFGHGLGHGVGLLVHELPSVGPRSDHTLLAGAVVTVEPGAYLPGWGGVRIEDLVAVEEGGRRVLTRSPKDLIEL